MKLNENYRVFSDDRNIILERRRPSVEKTKKVDDAIVGTGEWTKEYWEIQGYYPTYTAALRGFVGQELRSVPQEYTELLRKIDELMEVIECLEDQSYTEIARLQSELRNANKTKEVVEND